MPIQSRHDGLNALDDPAGSICQTLSCGDNADNDRLLRLYGFAVPGNANDRHALELRVEGAALECWNRTHTLGPVGPVRYCPPRHPSHFRPFRVLS